MLWPVSSQPLRHAPYGQMGHAMLGRSVYPRIGDWAELGSWRT